MHRYLNRQHQRRCREKPDSYSAGTNPFPLDALIDYELNPHLLNVKTYSGDDDELTRIMVEKSRARSRETDPEYYAFLVEKDEIAAAREKFRTILEKLNADIAKGTFDPQEVERILDEGRKIGERSRDWRARFLARSRPLSREIRRRLYRGGQLNEGVS